VPGPPRLPALDPDDCDDDARRVLAGLRRRDGSVLDLFATLAHHPKLLERWLVFARYVLGESTLDPRERELAILRVGWLCRSDYEWGQHVAIGRRAGLEEDEILRIPRGPEDPGWSERERLVLRATDELLGDKRIGDTTWRGLRAHWDERQVLDLVFAVGQYTRVSVALNNLGGAREGGGPGFPEDAG